jgi:proteasome assembly chaperone (PAC2) family protein
MEGELKGNLLKKLNERPEEGSKLKGKLIDNLKEEKTAEIYSEDWLKSQIIIQRDGGDRFEVKDIITQTSGTSGKRIVQLRSLEDGHSINKEFSELVEKVKTPGSAWSI